MGSRRVPVWRGPAPIQHYANPIVSDNKPHEIPEYTQIHASDWPLRTGTVRRWDPAPEPPGMGSRRVPVWRGPAPIQHYANPIVSDNKPHEIPEYTQIHASDWPLRTGTVRRWDPAPEPPGMGSRRVPVWRGPAPIQHYANPIVSDNKPHEIPEYTQIHASDWPLRTGTVRR